MNVQSRAVIKRIVVLGAGRVGSAMIKDLAKDREFQVTAVDASPASLARVKGKGIAVRKADLSKAAAVKDAVKDADLVVGAVPGFMGFATLKAVLEAGKDIVDICFFPEDPFRLDKLAKSKGLQALTDMGVAPGCDNLILGSLEAGLDRLTRFECLVGGLPAVRTWPYEYKAGFSPIDVLEEYTRPARYVAHGKGVVMPALSEPELVEFPGVGTLEAFNTDGLRTLIHTVDAPFKKEKTLRYPGHIEKMRMLRETGFFRKDLVEVGGARVVPLELTAKLLFPMWQMREDEEDFTVMRVVVEGEKGGEAVSCQYDLLDRYDKAAKTTSMARTTGYTCTAAVRMAARGLYSRKGVSPPEYVGREKGCWEFIRKELAKRGVVFKETWNTWPR
ncbi:MAG: saccharopine dehydrogenase NADP-binding domain-containing protein [Elusimicrobia bacterium]|nr:saccharopine dehydrogenase NADP-binding domain-containing protein [Elusimicrobiota bacterium]